MSNFQEKSTFIWNIADILRDHFDKNDFQKVILPFTVLKRFDTVLKYSKQEVVEAYKKYEDKDKNVINAILKNVAVDENKKPLGFYNYSEYDLDSLTDDSENINDNFEYYLDCFSDNIKDIFDNFDLKHYVKELSKKKLLYTLIKEFNDSNIDLSPKGTSNHEMGTIFEELIRRFSEQSNEESGEHFTPRDIVKLMTELMFIEEGLNQEGLVKRVYDPACGTGGMLTSCEEFIHDKNPNVEVLLYGQELKSRIYAICKSDMLMKGGKSENIKGPSSTLSDDQLHNEKFDYIISNPPYGTKWKNDKDAVLKEMKKGYDGRFGAGKPPIDDAQLLFIQHMISKMHPKESGKSSRIAVITSGSPLVNGDAGSGESDIRKWVLENDLLETLIALPENMFFNTDIGTYIWILSNKKSIKRKGKIQLIDARNEYVKMRRNLGKKRYRLSEDNINSILNKYYSYEESDNVKIFDNEHFCYTKITVQRPQQFNYQISKNRIPNIYLNRTFQNLAKSNKKDPELNEIEVNNGKKLQENIIKTLEELADDKIYKNWDEFEIIIKNALSDFNLKKNLIERIIECLAVHDDTAEYVLTSRGKIKEDPNLKEEERVPFNEDIQEYFKKEIQIRYQDAWIDSKKNEIGYEINFKKYFCIYKPPRHLDEINKDIYKVTSEIQELIRD